MAQDSNDRDTRDLFPNLSDPDNPDAVSHAGDPRWIEVRRPKFRMLDSFKVLDGYSSTWRMREPADGAEPFVLLDATDSKATAEVLTDTYQDWLNDVHRYGTSGATKADATVAGPGNASVPAREYRSPTYRPASGFTDFGRP